MDSDVSSGGFPINIIIAFVAFNRDDEIKEINHTPINFHRELNGWIKTIHERRELLDEFNRYAKYVIDVTSLEGNT